MRRRAPWLGAAMWLGTPAVTLAQAAPGPLPAPTVERIVARHIAARGGMERLRRIRTVRMVGRILLPSGMLGVDTVEAARPPQIRTTIHFGKATLVQAYDGRTAWGTSPFQGDTTPHPLDAENAKNVIAGADLLGPLVDYRTKGNRVTLVGVDTADGRPAYALRVLRPDSIEDTYYIDTTSALQVKWDGRRIRNGAPTVFHTYFRDYRRVKGLLMPFRLDSETEGSPGTTHILFDSIDFNVPIDRARFVMPGGRNP